jgi:hypothetical protein
LGFGRKFTEVGSILCRVVGAFYFLRRVSKSLFKGTVAWDGFIAHSIMFGEVILNENFFFSFGRKFAEISSTLVYVDLRIYGNMLMAYSPNMFKFFKRILHHAKILLANSEMILYKEPLYNSRNLQVR